MGNRLVNIQALRSMPTPFILAPLGAKCDMGQTIGIFDITRHDPPNPVPSTLPLGSLKRRGVRVIFAVPPRNR